MDKKIKISYFLKFLYLLFISANLSLFIACKTTAKRLDLKKDLVADTGELTRQELENSAINLAKKIKAHFEQSPRKKGIFVAFLPTRNETSEILATSVFDSSIVKNLRQGGIYTVKIKNRKEVLKEFEFAQSGLGEGNLSIGKLKSPNFLIECIITENIFRHGGDKIVEQVINVELTEVETLLVEWSDRIIYRKKAVSSNSVGW